MWWFFLIIFEYYIYYLLLFYSLYQSIWKKFICKCYEKWRSFFKKCWTRPGICANFAVYGQLRSLFTLHFLFILARATWPFSSVQVVCLPISFSNSNGYIFMFITCSGHAYVLFNILRDIKFSIIHGSCLIYYI